ncbi:MAG: integrase [Beijerinckiaceae bacterium]|nr:MAG: integrase [Beijerinckiaceae bacterium]
MKLNKLTALQVARAGPGRYGDGGGLALFVSLGADGSLNRKFVFRFTWRGKPNEMGMGGYGTTLAEARTKAAVAREQVRAGINPVEAKAAAKQHKATPTFGHCADALIKSKQSAWRSEKHRSQWRQTLETLAAPLWDTPVDEVDTTAVLAVLQPVWQATPETASRLRGRIEAVLDYAKAMKWRSGENPAAWRGHLALILPKRGKLSRGHHKAMPYPQVPAFMTELRDIESMPSLALQFLILTAARAGEVLGARWNEIDLDAKVWTIPAARMKAGVEHRVPLSESAMAILEKMAEIRTGDFVFAGQRRGASLSDGAFRSLIPIGATAHGFRSAFRDWCGNETSFPREIAEGALAHATGDATEQAYRRGDALEKRCGLMEAWASFCVAGGKIVQLRSAV